MHKNKPCRAFFCVNHVCSLTRRVAEQAAACWLSGRPSWLLFAVTALIRQRNFSVEDLQGSYGSGFFPHSPRRLYFFIYSLIFNLQGGEEDKMVAGGDENKSHPSLFIRHEKDTQ